jgi:hypothetical protein
MLDYGKTPNCKCRSVVCEPALICWSKSKQIPPKGVQEAVPLLACYLQRKQPPPPDDACSTAQHSTAVHRRQRDKGAAVSFELGWCII